MAHPEIDPNIGPARGTTDLAPHAAGGGARADRLAESIQAAARPQSMPVNMYESDGAIVIVAPLPGVMADDVEIEVHADRVRIWADCRSLAPKDYLLHEWHYGPYERVVELPEGFEGEPAASFGNGQLAVRIGRGGSRPDVLVLQPAG